jgi:hypothetical protein
MTAACTELNRLKMQLHQREAASKSMLSAARSYIAVLHDQIVLAQRLL